VVSGLKDPGVGERGGGEDVGLRICSETAARFIKG
jgi:hypothetical protein